MKKREFKIVSNFKPTGDQPQAIEGLVKGLNEKKHLQVLLGATGTGKTFTIANVIERVQKPTLVLVHNKTLAAQLYAEFKELFPNNRVEYFVSNFDFYQPEAYLPKSDTYIDKSAVMNEEIEMLRTSAINSILERSDTIIVGSVDPADLAVAETVAPAADSAVAAGSVAGSAAAPAVSAVAPAVGVFSTPPVPF